MVFSIPRKLLQGFLKFDQNMNKFKLSTLIFKISLGYYGMLNILSIDKRDQGNKYSIDDLVVQQKRQTFNIGGHTLGNSVNLT